MASRGYYVNRHQIHEFEDMPSYLVNSELYDMRHLEPFLHSREQALYLRPQRINKLEMITELCSLRSAVYFVNHDYPNQSETTYLFWHDISCQGKNSDSMPLFFAFTLF